MDNKSYTKKDFVTVYNELLELVPTLTTKWDVSNEFDPGVVLLKLDAIITDKLSYMMDKTALEVYPSSVTQDYNAKKIYDATNYRMHGYRSAIGKVSITVKQNPVIDGEENPTGYIIYIPAFTNFTDETGTINFVSLPSSNSYESDNGSFLNSAEMLYQRGETKTLDIIQGKLYQSIVSTYDITDNRVYLDERDVAENGIYISTNASSLNTFRRVDNINLYPNEQVFEFHSEDETGRCYLVFNDYIIAGQDVGSGEHTLYIKYIVSQGSIGNVAPGSISLIPDTIKFGKNDALDSEANLTLEDKTVLTIKNDARTEGGEDPETIDEAYYGYKLTIPKAQTLITADDYFKFVRSVLDARGLPLVSNCIVTDMVSDYNFGTYVFSMRNGIETYRFAKFSRNVESGGSVVETCDPYTLNLYALNNAGNYHGNFEPRLDNNSLVTIQNAVSDQECLRLTLQFPAINPAGIYLIKAFYKVDCQIITKEKITQAEAIQLETDIRKGIEGIYDSSKINFGEQIDYKEFVDNIIALDSRINTVIIQPFEYAYQIWTRNSESGSDGMRQPITLYEGRLQPDIKNLGSDAETAAEGKDLGKEVVKRMIASGKMNFYEFNPIDIILNDTKEVIPSITKIHSEEYLDFSKNTTRVLDQFEHIQLVSEYFEKVTQYVIVTVEITLNDEEYAKIEDGKWTAPKDKKFGIMEDSYSDSNTTLSITMSNNYNFTRCFSSSTNLEFTQVDGTHIVRKRLTVNDAIQIFERSSQKLPVTGRYVFLGYSQKYSFTPIEGMVVGDKSCEFSETIINITDDSGKTQSKNVNQILISPLGFYTLKPGEQLMFKENDIDDAIILYGEGTVLYNESTSKSIKLIIFDPDDTSISSDSFRRYDLETNGSDNNGMAPLTIVNTSISTIPGGTSIEVKGRDTCHTSEPVLTTTTQYISVQSGTSDTDVTDFMLSECGKPYMVIPMYDIVYMDSPIKLPDSDVTYAEVICEIGEELESEERTFGKTGDNSLIQFSTPISIRSGYIANVKDRGLSLATRANNTTTEQDVLYYNISGIKNGENKVLPYSVEDEVEVPKTISTKLTAGNTYIIPVTITALPIPSNENTAFTVKIKVSVGSDVITVGEGGYTVVEAGYTYFLKYTPKVDTENFNYKVEVQYSLPEGDTDTGVSLSFDTNIRMKSGINPLIDGTYLTEDSAYSQLSDSPYNYDFFHIVDSQSEVDINDIFDEQHPLNPYVICEMIPTLEEVNSDKEVKKVYDKDGNEIYSSIKVNKYSIEG